MDAEITDLRKMMHLREIDFFGNQIEERLQAADT
jgi:hypothetical protein